MVISQLLRASVLFLLVAFFAGCGGEPGQPQGEREVYYECPAPGGNHVASFYREYGGGAAGWQYEHVAVRSPADATPSVVLTLKQGYDVTLEWFGPDELRIGYPSDARVDHWQSWFGRMGEGHVEVIKLRGENGQLQTDTPGCVLPRRPTRG